MRAGHICSHIARHRGKAEVGGKIAPGYRYSCEVGWRAYILAAVHIHCHGKVERPVGILQGADLCIGEDGLGDDLGVVGIGDVEDFDCSEVALAFQIVSDVGKVPIDVDMGGAKSLSFIFRARHLGDKD